MRIKHRYAISDKKTNLIKLLEDYGMKLKVSYGSAVFEVFEDNSNWKKIKLLLDKYDERFPITNTVYSKKEILIASWVSVRSNWRWEYPQPEDDYKSITYNDSNFCEKCGSGLTQQESFYLKKEPKWGSRQFVQPFWVEDELFVKSEIADELLAAGLKGFSFLPVKNHKTKKELVTIKQMKVETILDEELIFDEGDINETINCPKCGKTKYILFGHTVLTAKKDSLKKYPVDVLKTKDIFGPGHIAARTILISNRFAKMILDKKWKNLVLEPIELM